MDMWQNNRFTLFMFQEYLSAHGFNTSDQNILALLIGAKEVMTPKKVKTLFGIHERHLCEFEGSFFRFEIKVEDSKGNEIYEFIPQNLFQVFPVEMKYTAYVTDPGVRTEGVHPDVF